MGTTKENTIHVLHVDDEPGILKVAKQILELKGHFQVDSTSSVEEAFSKMKLKDYDVIISDYQMPVKDGLQLLTELRANGNTIPFILFTGKGREDVAIEALNLGADRYINKIGKPETVYDELRHNIRQVVKNQKSMETLLFEQTLIRTLFDYSNDFIYFKDQKARYVRVSEPYLDFFKLSKEDIIGRTALDLFPDDVGKQIYDEELQIIKTRKPLINKEENSNGVWVLTTTLPWVDKNGNTVGLFGISRDITERKKTEEERNKLLNRYEERIKELRCLYVISKISAKSNVTLDEKIREITLFIPIAWQYPEVTCARIIFESQEFKTKNFRETQWKQHAKIKLDGKKVGVVEVYYLEEKPTCDEGPFLKEERYLIDTVATNLGGIIERKNFEELLRTSAKKYRTIINTMHDAVFVIDFDGKFVDVNDAAVNVLGYSRDELLSMGILDIDDSLTAEQIGGLVEQVKNNKEMVFETLHTTKTRKKIPVEMHTCSVIFNEKQEMLGIARDITERKKEMQMIEQSEAKLRSIVENSSDQIFMVDNGLKYLSVNKALVDVLGKTPEEIIGNTIYDVYNETGAQFSKNITKVFETGTSFFVEEKMVVQGKQFYISTSLNPVLDIVGNVIAVTGIVRDITKRMNADEEIRDLAKFPSENPNPVLRITKDGTLLFSNKAAEMLIGEQKLAERQHIVKLFQPSVLECLSSGLSKTVEFILEDKTFSFVFAPVVESGYVNVYGRDITERKKAEKEIIANEEKFHAISNSSQDAIILIDTNENISFWNPSAEKIFGYTPEEVVGKNLHNLIAPKRFHKDYLKGFTEFKLTGKGTAIGKTLELAAINKDGKEFPIELSISAFKLNDVWCSVGTIRDITERNIAWESLDKTINQLSVVNEKLGVVGRLTRHDVRNKLSAITGNIYLAKQKLSTDNEASNYLNETEFAVDQIERIFEFARIYEQLGVEELSYVDIGKSFDGAVSLVPSNTGVDFVNGCKGLMVLADSLLSQLMFTMIDNSLRHGEKVSRIKIHHKVVDDKLKIFIEDDGVGIPKEEKEIIFKEGYGKNSGLGLHLVEHMCNVYGWNIQETGTLGKGAQFTITIPKTNKKGETNYN